jgi:chaperone required for assembly of F1-ATPase
MHLAALQTVNFAAKLEKVIGKQGVQLELLDGAEHGDPAFETHENVQKVLAFLDKHLK